MHGRGVGMKILSIISRIVASLVLKLIVSDMKNTTFWEMMIDISFKIGTQVELAKNLSRQAQSLAKLLCPLHQVKSGP